MRGGVGIRTFAAMAGLLLMSAILATNGQSAYGQIISPSNNSFLTAGSNQEIAWVVNNDTTSIVVLQYSTDAGYSWNFIASTGIAAGEYQWVIPVGINSLACEVRIEKFTRSGGTTIASTRDFTITSVDRLANTNAVFSHRLIANNLYTRHFTHFILAHR